MFLERNPIAIIVVFITSFIFFFPFYNIFLIQTPLKDLLIKQPENLIHTITFLLAFLSTIAVYLFWRGMENTDISSRLRPFEKMVLKELQRLSDNEKYYQVLKMGRALSRSFFVEGHYEARERIGDLVLKASKEQNDSINRVSALIDDIGWSKIRRGEIDKGKDIVKQGRKEAEKLEPPYNKYWVAKSFRHLGSWEISKLDINNDALLNEVLYDEGLKLLEIAEEHSREISDDGLREEMIAGISYDVAVAKYFFKKYADAMLECEKYSKYLENNQDPARVCRIFSLKGFLVEAQNEYDDARDYYSEGYKLSKFANRADEIVKNSLGLARYYSFHNNRIAARKYKSCAKKELKNLKKSNDLYGYEPKHSSLPKIIR